MVWFSSARECVCVRCRTLAIHVCEPCEISYYYFEPPTIRPPTVYMRCSEWYWAARSPNGWCVVVKYGLKLARCICARFNGIDTLTSSLAHTQTRVHTRQPNTNFARTLTGGKFARKYTPLTSSSTSYMRKLRTYAHLCGANVLCCACLRVDMMILFAS